MDNIKCGTNLALAYTDVSAPWIWPGVLGLQKMTDIKWSTQERKENNWISSSELYSEICRLDSPLYRSGVKGLSNGVKYTGFKLSLKTDLN